MLMQRRFLWRRLRTTSSFIIKWEFSNNNRLSLLLEIFLPWNWLYSSYLFTLFLLFLIDTLEDLKFEFTTSNPSIEYSFLLQDPEESILPDKTDSRTLRVSSSDESPQTVIINPMSAKKDFLRGWGFNFIFLYIFNLGKTMDSFLISFLKQKEKKK